MSGSVTRLFPASARAEKRRRGGARLPPEILCLAAVVALLATPAVRAEKWGLKLFGDNKRYIILHADDAGMFIGANKATQDLLTNGQLDSASAMVPLQFFENGTMGISSMVDWRNDPANAHHDLGLHLTATSEFPQYRWGPSTHPPCQVRRILKRKYLFLFGCAGIFPEDQFRLFLFHAPRTLKRELEKQVDTAVGLMDPDPTHLDSHMGTVFTRKSYFKAYLEMARDHPAQIPALTFEDYDRTWKCLAGLDKWPQRIADRIHGARLRRAQAEVTPWPYPRIDQYCALPYDGNDPLNAKKALANLMSHIMDPDATPSGTITQFYLHPAELPDQLMQDSTASWRTRVQVDREIFKINSDGAGLTDLEEFFASQPDVVRTNWRELMQKCTATGHCP